MVGPVSEPPAITTDRSIFREINHSSFVRMSCGHSATFSIRLRLCWCNCWVQFFRLSVRSTVCPSVRLSVRFFSTYIYLSVPRIVGYVISTIRPPTTWFVCSFVLRLCGTVRSGVRLSVRPSVRPSVSPFVRPSVRPSVRPFVRPSVRPSVRPTVYKLYRYPPSLFDAFVISICVKVILISSVTL